MAEWVPLFEGHVCSLGYEVLDWIHAYCCHGPGDVQGQPLDYDDEIREFVIECYRLDPKTGRLRPCPQPQTWRSCLARRAAPSLRLRAWS